MWADDNIQCSHRGHQSSKMRILIVCTVILAYANAAPSHLIPLGPLAVQNIGYSAAIPIVSSGDIQAAAIDAHVKYADLAQAAVDKARLISEQAVENLNVNTYSSVAANQAQLTDAFWATEDKKWQTLDAIRTADAQLKGALASNAPALAKKAFVSPFVGAVVQPINPVIYPGIVAPATKSISNQFLVQTHPDTPTAVDSGNAVEASIKAAESSGNSAEASIKAAESSGNAAEGNIKAAESSVNAAEASIKTAETSAIAAESNMDTADTSMTSGASGKSELDISMKSDELEQSGIEMSIKSAEDSVNSGQSAKSEIGASVKNAEDSINSLESTKSEIEKSVKTAEAALEAAKSEADKAFAALHSTFAAGTVGLTSAAAGAIGLTNAYLTPNIYSVALTQPLLNPLQPIVPAVGQTYLKTLC